MKTIEMKTNSIIMAAVLGMAACFTASCGDSDELTPEVTTFAGEAIELPAPPYLTNEERDLIEVQRNVVKEAISTYTK